MTTRIEPIDPLTLAVKGWLQSPIGYGELDLKLSVWYGRWTPDVVGMKVRDSL